MRKIIIAIIDSEIPNLENLVTRFTKTGLIVNQVFEYGVIIGSADENTIKALKTQKEIQSIEDEKWYEAL